MFNNSGSLMHALIKLGAEFVAYGVKPTNSGKWRKTKHSLVSGITLVKFAIANEHRCLYCNKQFNPNTCRDWQIDHLVGQTDLLELGYCRNSSIFNITLACQVCNGRKGRRYSYLTKKHLAEHAKRIARFHALSNDDAAVKQVGYKWACDSVKFAKDFTSHLRKMGKLGEVRKLHGLQ